MAKHPPADLLPLWTSTSQDGWSQSRGRLMQRPIPWLWITVIGLLLLAPGFTARLFFDVLEGFALLLVFGPLVLAGAGFLAWQWFRRRLITCPACGTPSVGAATCPACGAPLIGVSASSTTPAEQTASSAVIAVEVRAVSGEP